MSDDNDPRTEGLGLTLRPPVRTASVPPPPRKPAPSPARPDDGNDVEGSSPGEQEPVEAEPVSPTTQIEVDLDEPPRVGSWRGGSVQVATSIPYAVADALTARSEAMEVTIGAVVMDAVRSEAPGIIAEVPPRPRRTGKTAVRQFLISPAGAEQLARHLDEVPATERMTVSLLLRHCLSRYLAGDGAPTPVAARRGA